MNQSSVLDFMLLSFGCDFGFRDEEWVGGNGEEVVGGRGMRRLDDFRMRAWERGDWMISV